MLVSDMRVSRVLISVVVSLVCSVSARSQAKDNVLIIIADDYGVDMVGCYKEGNDLPPTPNIDALAKRGILFRNVWANPSCSPTRGCITTGRFPSRHLIGRWIAHRSTAHNVGVLTPKEWTLPEVLDRANIGFEHAAIGKWHMNNQTEGATPPTKVAGWGTFTGYMGGQTGDYFSWPRVENEVEKTSTTYMTTAQTDDALSWIQAQTKPWVCYLAYQAPHLPFHVPPAHMHTQPINSSSSKRAKYKAMIQAMDWDIGRLFSKLGAATMSKTNVIFIGDNGSIQNMAVAPFNPSRAKGTPYEGGLNVPLIIAGPSVVGSAREEKSLACAVDVFATVLDMAGAQNGLPPYVVTDGVSLVPHLKSATAPAVRKFAYAEEFTGTKWPAPLQNGHAECRNDQFKLISWVNGNKGFYDLVTDPWEKNNLHGKTLTATQTKNFNELKAEISRIRTPLARLVPYGSNACMGSKGVPQLTARGTPKLGSTYTLHLSAAAPLQPALFITGISDTSYGGIPLPLKLSPFGAGPNCLLEMSIDIGIASTVNVLGGVDTAFTIPNIPAFVDYPIFHSFLILDPTAPNSTLKLVTSRAVAAVIGN